MDEESISNQFSPIDQQDSNDQFEILNANANEELPSHNLNEIEKATDPQATAISNAVESNENRDIQTDVDNENEQCIKRQSFDDVDKTNLNDDISDDEVGNFGKDDELDFEEGENMKNDDSQNTESLQQTRKQRPAEDGEVNSEEELEDGEVKEDSDDQDDDQYDGNMNNPNKSSSANLNALCRFYSKGLCTWGTSCRFIHQKPIGTSTSFSPKSNLPLTNKPPTLSTPPLISKSNESLNIVKPLINSYPKQNMNYNKVPLLPTNNSSGSSYYSNNQDQFRYVKKDPYVSKSYPQRSSVNDVDYDMYQSSRNKYADDRGLSSSSSNYQRNTSSSSNYYNPIKPHHHTSSSSQSTHHQSSSSTGLYTRHSSGNSHESDYERKRRLAFESAPPTWNDGTDCLNTSPLARDSPIDRHSQSSSSGKMYRHQHSTSLPSNYVKKPIVEHSNTSAAEHYRDPWRRSKSPQPFSGNNSNRGTPHLTTPNMYSKSKSDSGSNLSNSESELMDHSHAKSRRLDPAFAHKHRPANFREGSNGEAPFDHQTGSSNKKPYNYTKPPSQEELDNQTSYHHHSTSSTAYQKSSSNATEMDIPNYERPKNLPPRTRKDSWSDSDSCSSSSNSSYSGTGESESDSEREPYSRTNKFESTREVTNEPQLKRQRTISSENSRLSTSKPRSPYSPSNEFSSSSRFSTTGRKKHSIMNCEDEHSNERTLQKRLKSGRYDIERNGSNNDTNDSNASDSKKAELLQQLKAIEEEIARKRSKLK